MDLREAREAVGSKCRQLGLGLCSQKAEVQLPFQEAGEKQALCKDSGCSGGTEDTAEREISMPHPHDPYVTWDSEQLSLQKELSRASSAMTCNAPLTFPSSWGKVPPVAPAGHGTGKMEKGTQGKNSRLLGKKVRGRLEQRGNLTSRGPAGSGVSGPSSGQGSVTIS